MNILSYGMQLEIMGVGSKSLHIVVVIIIFKLHYKFMTKKS